MLVSHARQAGTQRQAGSKFAGRFLFFLWEVAVGPREDGHEIGVLLARELGISEEFVLRMVEAFRYFDKVFFNCTRDN